jgi:hypothetical protein
MTTSAIMERIVRMKTPNVFSVAVVIHDYDVHYLHPEGMFLAYASLRTSCAGDTAEEIEAHGRTVREALLHLEEVLKEYEESE